MELKFTVTICPLQQIDELPSEDKAEYRPRREEVRSFPWALLAVDPAGVILRNAAAGDYAMDVDVCVEFLPPSMEYGHDADLGAQVLRVFRDRAQCLRRCPEQNVVDDFLVLQGDARQLMRDREDDVEVLDGQDLLLALCGPLGSCCLLALGAVPVSA